MSAMPCASSGILRRVASQVTALKPGAGHLAGGLFLYLEAAQRDHVLAGQLAAAGQPWLDPQNDERGRLPADLLQAMRLGQVRDVSIESALDLIVGTMLAALHRIGRGGGRGL